MPSQQDHVDLWALTDLCTPWCVHVVATLGIAGHIDRGAHQIDALAEAAGADAESLHRLLRHLVGKGVFEEPSPGTFTLNAPARALLDPGARLGLDLNGFGGRMARAWGSLLSAVRTGKPAYHQVFGRPFWEDLQAYPSIAADFDALMGPEGHGQPDPDVLISGWESVRTIADIGGGTGALLAAVLKEHPRLQGILVDLPATVARSGPVFQSAGVTDRVRTVGQSFFEPLPAGADVYLLKSVLSDWPDAEAKAILIRCAEAARPAGRVVMLNGVSPEGRPPRPELLMMVLVGGKERGIVEFRELARTAGLTVSAAALRPSGRFIVECRPTA